MTLLELLPYIGSLIGAVGGILALAHQFRVTNLDESHKLFDDAIKLKNETNEMYKDIKTEVDKNKLDLEKLERKVNRLQGKVTYLRNGVDILIKQIIEDAKLTPAWVPVDNEEDEE